MLDCGDGSDECPILNETLKIQIDNDIKSNPKLTVDGIVHIQKELYRDYRYVHMCYVMYGPLFYPFTLKNE